MTISNAESREPTYTGTGGTATYAFTFPVYSSSDLQVTKATNASPPVVTTLALTADYTVTLSSTSLPSAGSITLTAGNLASGHLLSIRRVLPETQTVDLVNQGHFFAGTHEQKFDKLTMMVQQLQDAVNRCVKLPEQEAGTAVKTTLPDATLRATQNLIFDSSGNATAGASVSLSPTASAYIQTLLDDANAATARTTLGATGGSGLWSGSEIAAKTVSPTNLTGACIAQIFQARLTLTTNVPVTTSTVTGATSVFVTPYKGDKIALYDGTDWRLFTLTQVTASVPNTSDTMYDVFIYDSAGLTLDIVQWTNDTTRATALATQNGVLVKTGALGRRYVGSFRTATVAGTVDDSLVKRHCWNHYNRVRRQMARTDSTNTWAYTIDTIRQANGAAANQLDFIIGVSEDNVTASVMVRFSNTNVSVKGSVGIGLDSTTGFASGLVAAAADSQVANEPVTAVALWNGYPGVGRHVLTWLERSEAVGTTTWQGDNATIDNSVSSGIMGELNG